jgi:hypothetical protein
MWRNESVLLSALAVRQAVSAAEDLEEPGLGRTMGAGVDSKKIPTQK